MKALNRIFVMALFLFFSYSCAVQQSRQQSRQQAGYSSQGSSVNFQVFYDELSPYGQWVDYPGHGYVWMPDVRRNFAPYSTDGYWVNTEYGWTWVSDYKWGWAPFHYGRWDYDSFYGWFWVPDNVWGPSWVTWRSGNGYYGWAPMRPGINIHGSLNDGYRDINRWNFVRARDFGRSDLHRHYVERRQYNTIINNTTVINNTMADRRSNAFYVAGPSQEDVQRDTGRRINRVRVQEADRPVSRLEGDQLRIFRPNVERTSSSGQRLAPSRVTRLEEVKSVSERNTGTRNTNVTPLDNNPRDRQRTEPGQQIQRRRQERQMQPVDIQQQQQQKSQPVQPQVTPEQRQTDGQLQQRERQQQQLERQQQQQMDRQRQAIERQQQQETRRQEREQTRQQQQIERQQQQMQKSQPVQPQLTTPEQEEGQQQPRRRSR